MWRKTEKQSNLKVNLLQRKVDVKRFGFNESSSGRLLSFTIYSSLWDYLVFPFFSTQLNSFPLFTFKYICTNILIWKKKTSILYNHVWTIYRCIWTIIYIYIYIYIYDNFHSDHWNFYWCFWYCKQCFSQSILKILSDV